MTNKHHKEPRLIFFRDWPSNLETRPPLASSLQHLETSFLLVAIQRFPHALIACGSAIESAIKAAINATPHDRLDFKQLIDKAEQEFPAFTTLREKDIKSFRLKRNEIIHYGFSPKDDSISAIHLLRTGYILIEHCYKSFFQFALCGENGSLGGLLPEFAHHLGVAEKVYNKAQGSEGLDLTYCFIAFAHQIRWGMQDFMLSGWQKNLLYDAEESFGSSDFKEKQKDKLSFKTFDLPWYFNCPVCDDPESFVCELDDEQLDFGKVSLKKGVCVNCGLVIPKNFPYLADELCKNQFDTEKPKIFKELGLA